MAKPLRVLVVEDSEMDALLLLEELRRGGYEVTFERVDTAAAMTAALARAEWDIVIADYNMPNFSAPEALKLLQKSRLDLPFIIVSGSIGEDTAVAAMKAGAHDYMMKGNLKRLIPGIERELREATVRRERKKAEEGLQEREKRFRALIENSSDVIVLLNADGIILYSSPSVQRVMGYSGEFIGRSMLALIHPDDHPNINAVFAKVLQKPGCTIKVEFRARHKDGSWQWIEGVANNLLTEPSVQAIVVNYRDVTDRRQVEEMVQHMAFYDTLTELPNRNMLHDRLLNAIRTDSGEGKPMALLLMDLDHFKEINDTLGHHRGDLLLKELGSRLKSVLFEPDMVARLGGDEFAILVSRLAKVEDVNLVIRKIQGALESPFVIESLPVAVEASIGIALYPEHGENPDSLMQRADVAMYMAKETGSGYVIYDTKLDQHSPRRLALIGELRQAIEKDQLLLHYQPKISLKTHRVVGMEALVRWQHPEYGFVPPDQFILPAEQTGLIHPLTRWVLNAAIRQCQAWRQAGLKIPVSVNLSARNLHDPQLADHLAELLKTHGGMPEQLELEITESAIMADPQRALEAITRLRAMGLRFALDDFGIGYSSLAYLKKLPVDTIKIDKSFVIDMAKDEDDVLIVLSTINLAHNLGLKVVAEGVETEKIWDRLFAFGCDAAQGYYMSKPLPAADLTRWLKESPWGLK
jgi:diguanylate cyclase (GGDEF)-like protein/PAS domain S-box-containing protein